MIADTWVGRLRQHAQEGPLSIGGQRIAVEGGQRRFVADDTVRHDPLQRGRDLGTSGKGSLSGGGRVIIPGTLITNSARHPFTRGRENPTLNKTGAGGHHVESDLQSRRKAWRCRR
jgi:hypothetical protein